MSTKARRFMETNGCTNVIGVAINGTAKTRNLIPVQIENVAVNIGINSVSDHPE